jgi:hypothetical protein
MLALSHHILVQIAARRVGVTEWFQHYALLGDDIIIADEGVAGAYLRLMSDLGLVINLSKSFEMKTGGLEFAKRWISPTLGDLSPISPALILASIRDPRMLSTLIRDCLGRAFIFSTSVVSDLNRFLHSIRPRKWCDRMLGPIFAMVFGPTGGLWETASGPYYKAVWIRLFPHQLVRKFGKLIDFHIDLLADAQIDPLSVDESKAQLVSNFWKTVVSLGPTIKGLIWVPLSLVSPAFWVYYDHALQADVRLKDFLQRKVDFIIMNSTLWPMADSMRTLGHTGPSDETRMIFLDRFIKDTFSSNLLDWSRQQASASCDHFISLFKVWETTYGPAVVDSTRSRRPRTSSKSTVYQPTPTNLSLVLYKGTASQKILLRYEEVPHGTNQSWNL